MTLAAAVQQQLLFGFGELAPRGIDIDLVVFADRFEQTLEIARSAATPDGDGTLGHADVLVGHDERRINFEPGTQTIAALACAIRRVKREVTRRDFFERLAVAWA